MKATHIEHIGIAVANLEESIRYYEEVIGLKCYAIEEVADQKVKTAFFKIGDTKIELLESTDPEGPIGKFIEKKSLTGPSGRTSWRCCRSRPRLRDHRRRGCVWGR